MAYRRCEYVGLGCVLLFFWTFFVFGITADLVEKWIDEEAEAFKDYVEQPRIDVVVVNGQGFNIFSSIDEFVAAPTNCVKVAKMPTHISLFARSSEESLGEVAFAVSNGSIGWKSVKSKPDVRTGMTYEHDWNTLRLPTSEPILVASFSLAGDLPIQVKVIRKKRTRTRTGSTTALTEMNFTIRAANDTTECSGASDW